MENRINPPKPAFFQLLGQIPGDTRKGIRYFLSFLAFMLALTLLSNAANGVTIAKVTAVYPSPATVSEEVSVTGTVTAASKLVVSAPDDLRVDKIVANTGGKVKKEDVILVFDMDELNDQIKMKEAELGKLQADLHVRDVFDKSTAELDALQDLSELEAAEKEYENIRDRTQRAIDKAERDYQEANRAYTRARVTYRNAGNSSDVVSAMMRLERAETQLQEAQEAFERRRLVYDTAVANKDAGQEAARQEMNAAKKLLTAADKKYQLALDHYDDAIAESRDDGGGASRQDYEDLRNLRLRTSDAKLALEEAKADQQMQLEEADRKIREQENRNEISEITRENQQQNRQVGVIHESAQQRATRLEIERKQKEIGALTRFVQSEGKLMAPEDGTLMELNLDNDRTLSGKEAIQIATAAEGYEVPVKLDEDAAKDIASESKVIVETGGEKLDGQITGIATYPDEDKRISMTVKLPEAAYQDGQSAQITIRKKQAQYNLCIPLGALRNDSDGNFVYLLEEEKTILGVQTTLRRVAVEVDMKDDEMAAVSGALDSGSQILITSNKMVEGGDRVRLVKT